MIADMYSNKELNPVVTKLPITDRKLNISLVFITQCYFAVPKDIRLCCTRYLIMKILNKQELYSDIDIEILIFTKKFNSFLVIDVKLTSDSIHFRKNLIERYRN